MEFHRLVVLVCYRMGVNLRKILSGHKPHFSGTLCLIGVPTPPLITDIPQMYKACIPADIRRLGLDFRL